MGGTQLRSFFKPSSVLILSRQLFSYKMLGILTLFCLNPHNFFFSIKNHICSTTAQNFTGIKRLRIFWYIGLPGDAHLPKRPHKNLKMDSRCLVPRKLLHWKWYYWKCFFTLYNLSVSESSLIHWIKTPINSGIQPMHRPRNFWALKETGVFEIEWRFYFSSVFQFE